MKSKLSLNNTSTLYAAFFAIHLAFFLFLYRFIGWAFDSLSVIFLLLSTGIVWQFSHLFSKKISIFLMSIFTSATALYALVSMVFVPVFETFAPIGLSENQSTVLPTIFEFAGTLPWYGYAISLFYIFTAVFLFSLSTKQNYSFIRVGNHFVSHRYQPLALSLFGFMALFVSVGFLNANPQENWYSVQAKQASYGFYGLVADAIYTQVFVQPAYAQEGNQLTQLQLQNSTPIQNNTSIPTTTETIHPYTALFRSLRQPMVENPATITASVPSLKNETLPHIIVYQMESVPQWAMEYGIESMPFLQSLQEKYIRPEEFYPNGCHTIDAEFAINCSHYPDSKEPIASAGAGKNYYCLPNILSVEHGYETVSFHANNADFWNREELHPKWGITDLQFLPNFNYREEDKVVLLDTVEYLKKQSEPTFAYIVGFSSHAPHTYVEMDYLRETSNAIIDVFDGKLPDNFENNIEFNNPVDIQAFLGFMKNIDDGIRAFMQELEVSGLADNSIVVITSDHRYYNFYDRGIEDFYDYNRVPFVIIPPNGESYSGKHIASHIDIAPTLLHMIEGQEYMAREHFLGASLFETQQQEEVFLACKDNLHRIGADDTIVTTAKNATVSRLLNSRYPVDKSEVSQIGEKLRLKALLNNQAIEEDILAPAE